MSTHKSSKLTSVSHNNDDGDDDMHEELELSMIKDTGNDDGDINNESTMDSLDIKYKRNDGDDDEDDDDDDLVSEEEEEKGNSDESDTDNDNSFIKQSKSLNTSLQIIKTWHSSKKKQKKQGVGNTSDLASSSSSPTTSTTTTNTLQHSTSSQQHRKKILYTLWFVDPEWEDINPVSTDEEQSLLLNEQTRRMKFNRYAQKLIEFMFKIPLYTIQFISTKSARQSKLSPLHIHNIKQARAKLLVSDDGTILANTQNSSIVFRNSNDNFSTIQKRWTYSQYDKEVQWQRICFSQDNLVMAFSTSGCTIHIISIEDETTIHLLSPSVLGINPTSGIVDLVIRNTTCSLIDKTPVKCYELLVLGYDMMLRRFHFPHTNIPHQYIFSIHPFINSIDPLLADGCFPKTSPVDVKDTHYSVGSLAYCHNTDTLAIGGNRRSKRASNRSTVIKPFVSFYKFSEKQPYVKLLNKPPLKGGELDNSIDGINNHNQNNNNNNNNNNSSSKGEPKSILTKLTTALFGDYSQSIIHKVRFSKDGKQLIALDLNGSISLWNIGESFKPIKIWTQNDLIHIWDKVSGQQGSPSVIINNNNSNSNNINKNNNNLQNSTDQAFTNQKNIFYSKKQIIDLSWWSSDEIIVTNEQGEFVIFSMTTNENCLLHDPEVVSSLQPPILTSSHNGRFFILETSGILSSQPLSLMNRLSQSFNTRIVKPSNDAYKFVYRYFYGDHPADYDEFNFQIQRDEYGRNIFDNQNRQNQPNQQQQQQQISTQSKIIRKIIRFQSTTPEQLFKTKVAQKEYNNAIIIAEHYGLDKDLVHQKRWSKSTVSKESINSFLSKVQDVNWILWECHTRIPLTYENTKLLLEYGLTRSNQFKDDKIIIIHRNIILNYLNRLNVYKEIYSNYFDSLDYLRFRSCNLTLLAMEYASLEHFKAIQVLFSYYGKILLPERMKILSMIPETTDPSNYSNLLPDSNNNWEPRRTFEADWCQTKEIFQNVLEADYEKRTSSTYLKQLLHSLGSEYEDIRGRDKVNDIYSLDYILTGPDNNDIGSLPSTPLTVSSPTLTSAESNKIIQWYKERVEEIDRKSGQIDNSQSLLRIAIEDKHISGLNEFKKVVDQVNIVVYETAKDITLDNYKKLGDLDRIKLLLSDNGGPNQRIYNAIVTRCYPFFNVYAQDTQLLKHYFEDLAKLGNIKLCKLYLESLIQELDQESTGRNINDNNPTTHSILSIGISSIYHCSSITIETISQMESIINLVPEQQQQQYNSTNDLDLYDKLHLYRNFVKLNLILIKYSLAKTIEYFDQHHTVDDCLSLLNLFIKYGKQQSRMNMIQWRLLFEDFLASSQLLCSKGDQATYYSVFVKHLLGQGKDSFKLAKEYFSKCGSNEKVEQLVLTTAKDFFNSSSMIQSMQMEEARQCLDLVKPSTRKIIREMNLIQACQILNSQFQYPKIPIQIRYILEKSDQEIDNGRFDLIQSLLDTCPMSYKNINGILEISSLLNDWGKKQQLSSATSSIENDRVLIKVLVIKKSITLQDYQNAFNLSKDLIKLEKSSTLIEHKEIWQLFSQLALNVPSGGSIQDRLELLSYSLTYCNDLDLSNLFESYQELNIKYLLQNQEDQKNQLVEFESSNKLDIISKLKQDKTLLQEDKEQDLVPPFIELDGTSIFNSIIEQNQFDIKNDELQYYIYKLLDFNNVNNNKEDLDNLLDRLSKLAINQGNLKLAISYMNQIDKVEIVEMIFEKLLVESRNYNENYNLQRVLEFSSYYYALGCLLQQQKPIDSIKLLQQPIQTILKQAETLLHVPDMENDHNVKNFKKYYKLYIDCIQAKEFSDINNNDIDFEKFKQDEDYKKDVIYRFIKSNDLKSFQTAISMSTRYGIEKDEIYRIFLEWKILEDGTSSNIFVTSEQINNNTKLFEDIYSKINGVEYAKLICFYEILQKLSINIVSHPSMSKRIKLLSLLSKLMNTTDIKLNFKEVMEPSENDIFQKDIKSNLTKDNVSLYCNIISNLQSLKPVHDPIQNYSISHIYLEMIYNFMDMSDNEMDMVHQINNYKKQLDDHDLFTLYNQILIGTTSDQEEEEDEENDDEEEGAIGKHNYSAKFSFYLKLEIINGLLSDGDENEHTSHYQIIRHHLITMYRLNKFIPSAMTVSYNRQFVKLVTLDQPQLTLQQYHQFRSTQLNEIIPYLLPTKSPKKLKQIYMVFINDQMDYQELDLSEEDYDGRDELEELAISKTITKYYIDHLEKRLTNQQQNPTSILNTQFEQFKRDGSQWLKIFKELTLPLIRDQIIYAPQDKQFALNIRIDLLEYLQVNGYYQSVSDMELKEKDRILLAQLKTKRIIKETWSSLQSDPILDSDIDTPESCRPLFNLLIENCNNDWSKLSFLIELTIIWSNVGGKKTSMEVHPIHDCWFKLFQSMITYLPKSNSHFIRNRVEQSKSFPMTIDEENIIINALSEKDEKILLFKFGLLSNYIDIYNQVLPQLITYIQNHPSNNQSFKDNNNNNTYCKHQPKQQQQQSPSNNITIIDQQLIQIIYSQGLLYKFINTPIYQPLIDILKLYNNQDEAQYNGKDIPTSIEYTIAMLVKNHHHIQAASICLWYLNVHPLLHNLDNSLAILRKFIVNCIESIGDYLEEEEESQTPIHNQQLIIFTWRQVLDNLNTSLTILDNDFKTTDEDQDDDDNDE